MKSHQERARRLGSLGAGSLEGKVVTCPSHAWKYDVTTGKTVHVSDYGVGFR
jgi:nitrite reductase/ring-hydroxylating ferredoxin subunit